MQIRKAVISSLLLLAYTLVLAHDLIPHHHHVAGEKEHVHIHDVAQHHHHDLADHQHSQKHFAHQDHHDHGLVDFIMCMLSESEHPFSKEVDRCFLPVTAKLKPYGKNLQPIIDFGMLPFSLNATKNQKEVYYLIFDEVDSSRNQFFVFSTRGPPAKLA